MKKKYEFSKILKSEISDFLDESARIANFQSSMIDEIMTISEECIKVLNNGGKLLFCGNGGSASDSQHLAAELVNRFKKNRDPIPAIALTTDTSVITSIGNDFGFEFIFSKQIEAIANNSDLLFAISTSGLSQNIIEALKVAKNKGIKTVLFTGKSAESINQYVNHSICIPSNITGVIQQAHITIGQAICMNIENSLQTS
jgi:D-sedoheptulose 7-phosphate isomerase